MTPEIGPLAEVGLAQHHGTGGTESGDDERILRRDGACQGQRSRGRLHAVTGVDVVLDEHGHAVERATRALRSTFVIQCPGDGDGLGIDLDDRVKSRTIAIESVNPPQKVLREPLGGERTRSHASLHLGHGQLRQRGRTAERSGDAPGQGSQRRRSHRGKAQALEKMPPVLHVDRSI